MHKQAPCSVFFLLHFAWKTQTCWGVILADKKPSDPTYPLIMSLHYWQRGCNSNAEWHSTSPLHCPGPYVAHRLWRSHWGFPTHMSQSSLRIKQLQPCLLAVPSEPQNKEIQACCSEDSFAILSVPSRPVEDNEVKQQEFPRQGLVLLSFKKTKFNFQTQPSVLWNLKVW